MKTILSKSRADGGIITGGEKRNHVIKFCILIKSNNKFTKAWQAQYKVNTNPNPNVKINCIYQFLKN